MTTKRRQEGDRLREQAVTFAQDLSTTVRTVVGDHVDPFTATVHPGAGTALVVVRQQPREGIPLCVDKVPMLDLVVGYRCTWDHAQQYLAVQESSIVVFAVAGSTEPLFRFDYVRSPQSRHVPSAHIQVHAHRDAVTYVMSRCGRGSRRSRRRAGENERGSVVPRLAELHLPLGGQRFRPCLEDVLQMLIEELGVDARRGREKAVRAGRHRWRMNQIAASVRDSPETAGRALRELGYTVEPPDGGPLADKTDKLWMY